MEHDVVGQGDAGRATGRSPCPPAIQLPSTVQEVRAARLDRLPPAEKALLQTLAVIGSAVPWRLLTQVVGQPLEALDQLLGALQAAEFLYEQPAGPERAYRFKHVLTQEVVYAALPQERRRILHACTAQALETLYAERLEEHYGALAHHYRQSGNMGKAVLYLQRAGAQALQRLAYVEAHAHLTTGLEVLATVPETSTRHQHELNPLIVLSRVLRATKSLAALELEPVLTRAEVLAQQVGESSQHGEVLHALFNFRNARLERQAAHAVAEQLLDLAQRQQDPALLMGAHNALGQSWHRLGACALARTHFEQAIALDDSQQHANSQIDPGWPRSIGANCRAIVARVLWVLGYPDQAVQRCQEALTMAHMLASPFCLSETLHHSIALHIHRVMGAASRHMPEPAVAAPGQAGRGSGAAGGELWLVHRRI